VTAADVKAAANTHLDIRRSVTGLLLPEIARAPSNNNEPSNTSGKASGQ
jgi:hypothetical protein